MKERGILFKGHLVKKIQAGLKGQTRRVAKAIQEYFGSTVDDWPKNPLDGVRCENGVAIFEWQSSADDTNEIRFTCPHGVPGDRLYVRETWADGCDESAVCAIAYQADSTARFYLCDNGGEGDPVKLAGKCENFFWLNSPKETKWKPSIHMPRWASRLNLEILKIRVERVQDASEEDIRAEGIEPKDWPKSWEAINGPRGWGWDVNPWVWVIDFKDVTNER